MSTGTLPKEATNESGIDFEAFGDDEGMASGAPDDSGVTDETAAQFGDDETDETKAKDAKDDEAGDEDDDLLEGESADDDPEFDIDGETKLKRSEIKDLIEKRDTYSKYADEVQVVAREREALGKQWDAVNDFVPFLQAQHKVALDMAASLIPAEPDPNLIHTDTATYLFQKQMREQGIARYEQMREQAQSGIDAAHKQRMEKLEASNAERKNAEIDKLMKAVPALADTKKADLYLGSLHNFTAKYGFTKQETNDIVTTDHRFALMMRKAALYDTKVSGKRSIPASATNAGSTPRSIPAASRSVNSSQNSADRRSLAKTLQSSASRSDMMDKAASYFND